MSEAAQVTLIAVQHDEAYGGVMTFMYIASSIIALIYYVLIMETHRAKYTLQYGGCFFALICRGIAFSITTNLRGESELQESDYLAIQIFDFLSLLGQFIAFSRLAYVTITLSSRPVTAEQNKSIQQLLLTLSAIMLFSSAGLCYTNATGIFKNLATASAVILYCCFLSVFLILLWAITGTSASNVVLTAPKKNEKVWKTQVSAAQICMVAIVTTICLQFISTFKSTMNSDFLYATEFMYRLSDATFYYAMVIVLRPTEKKKIHYGRRFRIAAAADTS